jgi:hypothetical protein
MIKVVMCVKYITHKKVRRFASALLISKCLTGLLRNPLSFTNEPLGFLSFDLGKKQVQVKQTSPEGEVVLRRTEQMSESEVALLP